MAVADVLCLGEAMAMFVPAEPGPAEDVRVLPEPSALVVKQAEDGATLIEGDSPAIFQPALRVDVVEPGGRRGRVRGGYLAALLAGEPPVRRLRAGHLRASSALRTHDDVCPPLPGDTVTRLLDADEAEWRAARIS